ncbi:MAG: BBP7 family outer membrane beta-barrel protein [Gemmataceae bacterium]|nr:BBP7 family outer membrane beta-barrel protein [Gemmataceae bacterium]MCI0739490.1 BBP7 family outer membrane beta-barrel protein [Gemmataceae bacterium]
MTKRLLTAVCVSIICAGSTYAQTKGMVYLDAPQVDAPQVIERPIASSVGPWWALTEYQVVRISSANLPPLITTSPPGTARAEAGVIGAPGASVLVGGSVNDDPRSGFRFDFGRWFGAAQHIGVEAGFTILESQSSIFSLNSDGNTILARPFTNADTELPQAVLVAFPGSSAGTVDIRAISDNFYEFHVDFTEKFLDIPAVTLTSILGYRYYRYDEGLRIFQSIAPTDPTFVPGTLLATTDEFVSRNDFHGLDMGARAQFFGGQGWSLEILGKAAVGYLRRQTSIKGDQMVLVPGVAPVVNTGGVYALSSNIGVHSSREWTAFPELGVTLGWQMTSNLRVSVGYRAMFLIDIARAHDQIDFTVNPNLFPPALQPTGAARPLFRDGQDSISIQSINFGVELTF